MKNYIADISRFVRWYENVYPKPFAPEDITDIIINKYFQYNAAPEKAIPLASARSFKRYQVTLNKFFTFLKEQDLIAVNPFNLGSSANTLLQNPQATSFKESLLKSFKSYLFTDGLSSLTLKNYIHDINHFLSWIETVWADQLKQSNENILYNYITTATIQSYKNRLQTETDFSPISINRKLSSIRKFTSWLYAEGLIGKTEIINIENLSTVQPLQQSDFPHLDEEINTNRPADENIITKKSRFAPVRVGKVLSKLLSIFLDSLLVMPLVALFAKLQYLALGSKSANLFKSLAAPTKLPQVNSIDNLILQGLSQGRKNISVKQELPDISNISKSFYAPLAISLSHLPFHKRLIHNLRHKRPLWYQRYHEYRISHYLHFSLLLVFIGILVFYLQYNFLEIPASQEPVFASLPLSPPRLLSFKGRLTDDNNNPITTQSNLRFSLYRDETSSGSALLWQEVLSVTPDENGNFLAQLGRSNYIPERTFSDNPELFIGVTKGQESEMSPRQKLATVSLAKDAQTINGLKASTFSEDSANTLLALDSLGNLSINGSKGTTFQSVEGNFRLTGQAVILETNVGSSGNLILSPDGLGTIDLQKPLQNSTLNNNYSEALGSVEVNDTFAILATSSAVPALNIRQDSTGMLISASNSGTAKFTVDFLGNTLIQGSLALNGGSLTTTQTTFNFLPENVINLNIGASSTELNLGSTSGNTIIRNNLLTNGNITLGQDKSDSIYFNGSIASHITASESGRFDIGSADKSFNNAYLTNLFMSPSATTSGFLKRENLSVSLINSTDSLILGGSSVNSALIKLAGVTGQDTFFNAGKVGIGLNTGLTDSLQVYGDIRVGTTASDGCLKRYDGTAIAGTCSSDERLKKDIKPIEGILDKITSLTPVTYSMRKDEFPEYNFGEGVNYGLIAQEVEKLFPDLVETDGNGYKMVKYGPELTMLTLAAVKELNSSLNEVKENLQTQELDSLGNIYITKNGYQSYEVTTSDGSTLNRINAYAKLFTGILSAGLIKAQEGIFDSIAVASEQFTISGVNIRDFILDTIENSDIANNFGISTSELISGKVKTNFISPVTADSLIAVSLENSQFSILNSQDASASAVATFDRQGNATLSGTLQAQNILTNDASISGTLRAGKIIANEIAGLEEKLASISTNATSSANITNIFNVYTTASNSAQSSEQLTPTPANSPALLAGNSSSGLPSSTVTSTGLQTDFMSLASSSAALAYVPNLNSDFLTVHQGLMVLGYTSVVDLSASDRVSIGGSFILAENSINVLGADLQIQPLKQGNISFMSGLMTLDTQGNLAVLGNAEFAKNISIKGKLSASVIAPVPGSDLVIQLPGSQSGNDTQVINNAQLASQQAINNNKLLIKNASGSAVLSVNNVGDIIASGTARFKDAALGSLNIIRGASADTSAIDTVASGSAGIGTITKGYTSRTIYSPYVKENSLIYITPRSAPIQSGSVASSVPYLSRQVPEDAENGIKGSFTVQIPNIELEEIQFNWWIIN